MLYHVVPPLPTVTSPILVADARRQVHQLRQGLGAEAMQLLPRDAAMGCRWKARRCWYKIVYTRSITYIYIYCLTYWLFKYLFNSFLVYICILIYVFMCLFVYVCIYIYSVWDILIYIYICIYIYIHNRYCGILLCGDVNVLHGDSIWIPTSLGYFWGKCWQPFNPWISDHWITYILWV